MFSYVGKLLHTKKAVLYIFTAVLCLAYGLWAVGSLQIENAQWKQAGFITKNTLGFLKKEYPLLTAKNTIYFANTPEKWKNAWVFPVGLEDGVWFVYRDALPQIKRVTGDKNSLTPLVQSGAYVFMFQKDGSIKDITK
jgi:hypothetical protein